MIIEADIGRRIRQFRRQNDFTLQELSDKTGFSKGYLSKVEKSEKAPPVATLSVIAKKLGVTVSNILGEDAAAGSICLVRQNERTLVPKTGEKIGYAFQALADPYPHKHMEPFILSYPSDGALKHTFQHDGEEMLYMLQGQMRFRYGGREFILNKGDCIYFDSSIAHTVESIGEMPLKTLIVIYSDSPIGPANLEHIKRRMVT